MRPNFLIFFLDELRWDCIRCNGNPFIKTPNIDRIAAEGVNFKQAYSTTPVCIPARHNLLTGKYSHTTGIMRNGHHDYQDQDIPTFANILTKNGYFTECIGKMHFFPERAHHGFQKMLLSEEIPFYKQDDDYLMFLQQNGYDIEEQHGQRHENYYHPQITELPEDYLSEAWVGNNTVQFLKQNRNRPFFCFTSFIHPHPPFAIPAARENEYNPADMPLQDSPININIMGWYGLANRSRWLIDEGPDGKIRFCPTDPNYREMLVFLNKLYTEKLFDNQGFVQDRNAAIAKGASGVVGSAIYNSIDMIGIPPAQWNDWVVVAPLKSGFAAPVYSNLSPLVNQPGAFAITNRNKNPEITMRWLDYFYSDEGATLYMAGIEGLTFFRDADGVVRYMPVIANNPNGLNMNQATGLYSPLPGGCDPIPYILNKAAMVSKEQGDKSIADGNILKPYFPSESWPNFLFTDVEQNELTGLEGDISTYVTEMVIKFIMGTEPLSNWDNYVNTLNKMGLPRFLQLYGTALDRWNKS